MKGGADGGGRKRGWKEKGYDIGERMDGEGMRINKMPVSLRD